MSTRTFLLIVGSVIAVLLGVMLVQKYEDCLDRGGKACPVSRSGRSMDPLHRGDASSRQAPGLPAPHE